MIKLLTIIIVMVGFTFSAQAKDKFQIYLEEGQSFKLLGLRPGEPGNSKSNKIVAKKLKKYQGKTLVCKGLTDGIKCQGLSGWKDQRCQASLAIARCRQAADALKPYGIKVLQAAGGEYKTIGGKYRGVVISMLKTGAGNGGSSGISNCKPQDLKDLNKVYYNDSRRPINGSISVIPEIQKPGNIHKNKVVYITYSPFIKDGKLLYPLPRVCRARVDLAESQKKIVKETPAKNNSNKVKTDIRIIEGKGTTQVNNPKSEITSRGGVVKEKKTVKTVKDPKPEPKDTEDATSELYLTIGGIYGKPCSAMSAGSAFNLSVALGYHLFNSSKGMFNGEFGVTTSSRTVLDGNDIVEKSHEFNFHVGIEALGKLGPVSLGGGYKLLFNQHFEYQNRLYLKAMYHLSPSFFIYGEAGVALFKYRDEYRLDEDPENSYFIFGGVGIGFEF